MHPYHYGQSSGRDPRDRPPPPAPPRRPSYREHDRDLDYGRDHDHGRDRGRVYDRDHDRAYDRDHDRAWDSHRDSYRDRAPEPYPPPRGRERHERERLPPSPTDGPSTSATVAGAERPRVTSGGSSVGGGGGGGASTTGSNSQLPSGSRALRASPPPPPHASASSAMSSRPSLSANPFREGAAAPSSSRAPGSPGRLLSRRADGRNDASEAGSGSRPTAQSISVSNEGSQDRGGRGAASNDSAEMRKRGARAEQPTFEPSQSLEPGEIPDLAEMTTKYVGLVGEYGEARAEANTANVAHKRLLKITPQTEAMAAKVKTADGERNAAESKRDALEARCASLLQRIVDAAADVKIRGLGDEQASLVASVTRQVKEEVEQRLSRMQTAKGKEPAEVAATTVAAAAPAATADGDVTMAPPEAPAKAAGPLPPGVGRVGEAPLSPGSSRKRKAEALERVENLELEQHELRLYVDEQMDNLHEWVRIRLRSARAELRRESLRTSEKESGSEEKKKEEEVGIATLPPPAARVDATSATAVVAGTQTSVSAATQADQEQEHDDEVVFNGTNPAPTPTQRPSVAISAPATTAATTQTTLPAATPAPATAAPPEPSPEVIVLRKEVQELRSALQAQGLQLQHILAGLAARDANLSSKTSELDRQINTLVKQATVDRKFIGGLVGLLSNVPEPPVVGPGNKLIPPGALAQQQQQQQQAQAQARTQAQLAMYPAGTQGQSAGPSLSVQTSAAVAGGNHAAHPSTSSMAPTPSVLTAAPNGNNNGGLQNGFRHPNAALASSNGPQRSA